METAYRKLEIKMEKISRLNHFLAISHWDQATMMPKGGADSRAKSIAELTVLIKGEFNIEMQDLLSQAEEDKPKLNSWELANLVEIKRSWDNENALPEQLTKSLSIASSECEFAWRELRAENNWKDFLPLFKKVISLTKEESLIRAEKTGLKPYDAMINIYEPGLRSEFIDKTFDDLKLFITGNINQILDKQNKKEIIQFNGTYLVEKQKKLGLDIMKSLGFDFNRGRLDVSHHPFCGGVPEDVRITTRYNENDFMDSLMGVIHETGHARYEQGLPVKLIHQPVANARGMALHESQSLFFEMQVARGEAFSKFLSKHIVKHFGEDKAYNANNLYLINKFVKKDFIRVEADEVTYPLHIILRYEIEKGIMDNSIPIEELPEVWDEKMKKYFNLSTKNNYKDGCMQDTHWPSGLFGYFPTYTFGALLAAQIYSTISKKNENLDDQIAKGDFSKIGSFLEENIWSKASSLSFDELITSATGSPLTTTAFKSHIKLRYLN